MPTISTATDGEANPGYVFLDNGNSHDRILTITVTGTATSEASEGVLDTVGNTAIINNGAITGPTGILAEAFGQSIVNGLSGTIFGINEAVRIGSDTTTLSNLGEIDAASAFAC